MRLNHEFVNSGKAILLSKDSILQYVEKKKIIWKFWEIWLVSFLIYKHMRGYIFPLNLSLSSRRKTEVKNTTGLEE